MKQGEQHVIETKNLSKSFDDVKALQGVDLFVPYHSIFGFLGPNGAGKSTLMKILMGLAFPTSGGGTIFGEDIIERSISIRERIGYLPQHPRFIEKMTARQNLEFSAKFFFTGPISKIQDRCKEMLNLVGLAEKADRPIRGFSGGEKQRLGIALAQINYPDLLILDEPASALDPIGRKSVLELMKRFSKYTTIFFSTHILDDVQRVSDSVGILDQGSLVASGPIDQLLNGNDGVVYSISVKGEVSKLDRKLNVLPWVSHTSQYKENGSVIFQIAVNDENVAEKELLRKVLDNPAITVTEFSRKQYELDDVFIKIINGGSNVGKP